MLSLYRTVEFYCSGLQLPACEAFKKWCHVLDILVSIPELKPLPGVLQHACEAALEATIKADWGSDFKPKYHWVLHFSDAYYRFKILPSCWALERKHKYSRQSGANVMNTAVYERSVLEECLADHMDTLLAPDTFRNDIHLASPRTPTKKLKELLVGEGMILPGSTCFTSNACKLANGSMFTKGDYVLIQQGQGYKLCCVVTALMLNDIVYVVVSACQLLTHSPEKKSSTWEDKPWNLEWAFGSHVLRPVIWHKSAANKLTILLPAQLCC